MKKVLKCKKTLAILVFALMLTAIGTYGFAVVGPDKSEVEKDQTPKKEISKMYDKNNNKIFENLEKKLEKASDKENLPVIVVFKNKPDKNNLKNILGNYKTKHEYKNIPAIAMELNKGQIKKLTKLDLIEHIEYDEPVRAFNDTANYWFGTEKARSDFNVEGDKDGSINQYSKYDIVVAVIDTGIDYTHVDLDGSKVIAWKDYVNGRTTPYDDNDHGTHVAGIIAGEGDGNPDYKGVAEGAALVGLKVLDKRGSGSMSDVTAAIDWCVTYKDTYGIDVINLSLGTSSSSDGTDATSLAVNNAVDNGITVVVAAGNAGPAKYTIGSPGAAEKAITVAAMADVGELGFNLTDFSSRGPTADGRTKPDVSAPGYNITAPEANSSNGYITYSGTSMATPFTAGTVALMLDANPSLSPTEIKNILMNTAEDWGPSGKDIEYGMGRLDGYEAIETAGNFNGSNLATPNHIYASETLSGSQASDIYEFTVNNTNYPVAVTLIMPNWTSSWFSTDPDFDVYVYDPSGNTVGSSTTTKRQENVNFTPTQTGTYTIEVYSYSGDGSYFFDLSTGGSSLTLTQDQ
ncbi:S8 family serine peptidase [Caldisalinibacter kiritimatiensis]|uniref:Peptidase S8 and S53, subtilisin, kexin, sedolisin n=1 Tax=Caldisalinibacter kiritimatiensis TaxID=1304284 RepID=R1AR17_9FIRM|nr:S8 family serine peptidase [Caldisalinibacter kiritimatiensis]EOC99582.1 peptidase S8 and S53, subtilisin, kexin, sedolisin [Caldisalinibacter kiritimatiensis]